MTRKSPCTKRFCIGQKVHFGIGDKKVTGTIIEDRGCIGVNGRRLYRIEVSTDGDPLFFECPAEELNS